MKFIEPQNVLQEGPRMAEINFTISGHLPYISSKNTANYSQDMVSVQMDSNLVVDDIFEQGQRVGSRSGDRDTAFVNGIQQCSCGNCPACVSRSYAEQANKAGAHSEYREAPENAAAKKNSDKEEGENPMGTSSSEESESLQKKNDKLVKQTKDNELSTMERFEVARLQKADTAIRAHERAHIAAAGQYAKSGATYEYERGPDGKDYAVHGEVQIDTSKEVDPKTTINKMKVVTAAALAPINPSPADRRVAARARAVMIDASQELRMIKLEEAKKLQQRATQEIKEVEEKKIEGSEQTQALEGSDSEKQIKFASWDDAPVHFKVNSSAQYTSNIAHLQYDGLVNIIV